MNPPVVSLHQRCPRWHCQPEARGENSTRPVLHLVGKKGGSGGRWEVLSTDLDRCLLLAAPEPRRGFVLGWAQAMLLWLCKPRGPLNLAGLPAEPAASREFQEASGPRGEPFEYLGHRSKQRTHIWLFAQSESLALGSVVFFFFPSPPSLLLSNLSFAAGTRGVRSWVFAAGLWGSISPSRGADAGRLTQA